MAFTQLICHLHKIKLLFSFIHQIVYLHNEIFICVILKRNSWPIPSEKGLCNLFYVKRQREIKNTE